jgi:transcriptional regulator with XRE-family HTH domain
MTRPITLISVPVNAQSGDFQALDKTVENAELVPAMASRGGMSEYFLAERGKKLRSAMAGRGLTEESLARLLDTNQQTINKIINGLTQRSGYFPEMQRILGLSVEDLIEFRNVKNQVAARPVRATDILEVKPGGADFPIYASAEGGPGEIIVSSDAVEYRSRPEPLFNVSKSYGIIVTGESMQPEFEPGDVALVHPHQPPERGKTHIFYAEKHGETRATIKRLIRWTETNWIVEQWNPAHGHKREFTLPRREWTIVHRVIGKYSR